MAAVGPSSAGVPLPGWLGTDCSSSVCSWPDLIVGAPYFYERQEELGGAVYVYLNQGGHWADVPSLRLCGSPDSMFGISLAVLGDLNQDGFPGGKAPSSGGQWGTRGWVQKNPSGVWWVFCGFRELPAL